MTLREAGINLAEEDASDDEVMPKIKPETLLPDKKRPSSSGVPGPSTSARKKRDRKGAATRVNWGAATRVKR
jgi:hypothetical protein